MKYLHFKFSKKKKHQNWVPKKSKNRQIYQLKMLLILQRKTQRGLFFFVLAKTSPKLRKVRFSLVHKLFLRSQSKKAVFVETTKKFLRHRSLFFFRRHFFFFWELLKVFVTEWIRFFLKKLDINNVRRVKNKRQVFHSKDLALLFFESL